PPRPPLFPYTTLFRSACELRGRDYLERVRYLMADYSPHVLARAMERVSTYAPLVECLELDFRNPIHGLAHLRGKVLFAHTCNLRSEEHTSELQSLAYL